MYKQLFHQSAAKILAAISIVMLLLPQFAVSATATVTVATGGGSISANSASDGDAPAFTTLTGPSLTETDSTGMPTGSMILTVPTGFVFDTTAASVTVTAGTTTVNTVAANAVKRTSANLRGMVNAQGSSLTVTFQYGTDSSFLTNTTTVTANPSPVTGATDTPVTYEIPGGLSPLTLYYFRVVGQVGAGTPIYGSSLNFTTLATGTPKTYYVDKTNAACSDAGSGTISAPFCTIGAGAALADAGDTVYVLHGSYAETVKPIYNGGPGALLLTFKADPGVTVTGRTDVPLNQTSGGAFRLFSKGYIVIDGFTIGDSSNKVADNGINVTSSQYITISHNHISYCGTTALPKRGMNLSSMTNSTINANTMDHNTDDGILLRNSSNNNTISNNISFANAMVTSSQAAGLSFLGSTNNTVSRNIVYGNEDSGMNFYSASGNNIVVNNLSFGNGDHGMDNNASPSNQYTSNTVYGNGTSGINFESSSGGATLYNNISVDNGYRRLTGGGTYNTGNPGNIRFDDTSITPTPTLDYDIVYSSTTDNIMWNSAIYSTMAGFHGAYPSQETHGLDANPTVTPLFVGPTTVATRSAASAPYTVTYNPIFDATHPTGDDYHLKAGSIAIDSANSNAPNEQATDIEGNPRVDDPGTTPNTGTGVRTYDDRGAYEFQPKWATTTTITSHLPEPSVVGQSVTINFNVIVTPPATGTPTGSVTMNVLEDSTLHCTGTLAAGTGSCSIAFTTAGTKTLTATYAGDTNFTTSVSSPATVHTVNKADTTTSISSTLPDTTASVGQTVMFFYGVVANLPGSGTPTGDVTVNVAQDPSLHCTGTVSAGSCSIIFTTPGPKTLSATYAGDSNFNTSTSAGKSFNVVSASTSIYITNAVALATPTLVGQGYQVTYSITPSASGTPTGNVTVSDGFDSCITPVASGMCTLTSHKVGVKAITATYEGDINFGGSVSTAVPHTVFGRIYLPLILR